MRKSKLCRGKNIGSVLLAAMLVCSLNITVIAENVGQTEIQVGSEAELLAIEESVTEVRESLKNTDENNISLDEDFVEMWEYETDDDDQTILLTRYIGAETDVVVPAKVTVGEDEYEVVVATRATEDEDEDEFVVASRATKDDRIFGTDITSVRFEDGGHIEDNDMSWAFEDCVNLKSVVNIPSGVRNMTSTFYGCNSLITAPEIPSNVFYMNSTFSGCSSLISAPEIPSEVFKMNYTFYGCSSLKSAPKIPSEVSSMNSTFSGCSSLISAPEIPSEVFEMNSTFSGCSSLITAPEIPSGVTDMDSTFSGCSSLITAPVIPSGVTDMDCTFSGCSSLITAPVIPAKLKNMFGTFSDCRNLIIAPKIPAGVTYMDSTFSGCSSLITAPVIPAGVTDMESTFSGCSKLSGELTLQMDTRIEGRYYFERCFMDAATSGSGLTINYTSSCTKIDDIIATKSPKSNITKGRNIDNPLANQYQLIYNPNGGTVHPTSATAVLGSPYGTLPTPTRANYKFEGWYTAITGGSQVNSSTIVTTAKNHTLYARWSAVNYRVTYDGNGGMVNQKYSDVMYLNTYGTLPTPTRKNYTFNGWYTAKRGGSKITSSSKVTLGANHTLYAQWNGTTSKVSYHANGGKISSQSKTVSYGSTYGTLAAPKRANYEFKGWYTSKKGGSKITSQSKVTTTKSHTLYAQWSKISVNKITGISFKNSKSKQLSVSIKKVKGAGGYQIVYGTNTAITKGKKTVYASSAKSTLKKLKKGKTYYIKARAYKVDSTGQKVFGAYTGVKKVKIQK